MTAEYSQKRSWVRAGGFFGHEASTIRLKITLGHLPKTCNGEVAARGRRLHMYAGHCTRLSAIVWLSGRLSWMPHH